MAQRQKARVRVGVAGWYYSDWQGVVYPPGRGTDNLRYLAGFVDVIEINTTFYRPPEIGDVAGWCERVADLEGFVFTAKLWQRFTHQRGEPWRPEELKDFLWRISPIFEGGFGGVLLAQFPHSFHRTAENESFLKQLVRQMEGIPVVAEVRHYTWNDAEAFAMLRELGVGLCAIDQPLFRGSLKPLEVTTSDVAYVRFHGRNKKNWFQSDDRDERYDYLYSAEELGPWVERARRLAEKATDVYVIANNHFRGQAVCTSLMFKSLLTGERVRAPAVLIEKFPELKRYTQPDAPMQQELFS
jgi:uncharacterized protein YecE (DUF72 family)